MTILAIDQGTTSTRAVEVREDGTLRVLRSIAHRQIYPRPGWVEHDPEELLANIHACLSASGEADTIGIANQGESCLAWDAVTGAPASPVIVWQDERTADETERLRADGAEALTLARAGLPLDPYFSASKLGWLLRNNAEAQDLARRGRLRLGTTDAWFRQRLTGRCETDAATASRTSLMDLATCTWDAGLCALFGVPMEALPAIGPTSGDLGRIGGRALAASIVDQQAALRGHGCSAPGDAKITFGTGAFALAVAGAGGAHGGPGPAAHGRMAAGRRGAGLCARGRRLRGGRRAQLVPGARAVLGLGRDRRLRRPARRVARPRLRARACRAGLPALGPAREGRVDGHGARHGPRDLVQAVLEGVAFRTAEVLRAMEGQVALSDTLSIDGGMTRNPWFCRFLADALGKRLLISQEAELTALGVARLAAQGRGRTIDRPVTGEVVEPRGQPPEWMETFAEARRLVRAFGRRGTGGPC
jgi:glycerol kinase